MNAMFAHTLCALIGCSFDSDFCVCARCGRERHAWRSKPELIETCFDLMGADKHGQMMYEKIDRYRYTCVRCGSVAVKNWCKPVIQ